MEAYVPKEQIISDLGGHEEWTYKYVEPVPGENDLMKDTEIRDKLLAAREGIVKEYENATLEWIHGAGDVEGVKKSRNEIAGRLKVDYWNLDPYLRARSYYDRVGMINPGEGYSSTHLRKPHQHPYHRRCERKLQEFHLQLLRLMGLRSRLRLRRRILIRVSWVMDLMQDRQ